jgi:hypothetical protein
MPYGNLLADVVQGSTANTPPVFKDGNGTTIGTLCRAWVNFNGTGTVAIRASFNVSSITDNGVGKYRVNFTTALTDANYSCTSNAETSLGSTAFADLTGVPNGGRATTYVDVICINSTDAANFRDATAMMVAIHR